MTKFMISTHRPTEEFHSRTKARYVRRKDSGLSTSRILPRPEKFSLLYIEKQTTRWSILLDNV